MRGHRRVVRDLAPVAVARRKVREGSGRGPMECLSRGRSGKGLGDEVGLPKRQDVCSRSQSGGGGTETSVVK